MFYIFEIEFAKSAVERVIYMLMENRFRVLESDCLLIPLEYSDYYAKLMWGLIIMCR